MVYFESGVAVLEKESNKHTSHRERYTRLFTLFLFFFSFLSFCHIITDTLEACFSCLFAFRRDCFLRSVYIFRAGCLFHILLYREFVSVFTVFIAFNQINKKLST